jgi:hypothetical protein
VMAVRIIDVRVTPRSARDAVLERLMKGIE